MFTTEKNLLPAVALGCTVLLAAGCTDHQQLKKEVVQAAQKQEEIRSYHFTGTMDLKLDPALFQGVPPLTAGILSLLKESRIEYAGAASLTDAVQMEADIKITPKGASAPTIVPILIKDNKLYMQLPAVNKPDEYMAFPLDSTVPGSPAAADRLKNTGRLTSALSAKLFEGLDPNWLDTDNKTETLPDGTTGKHIKLEISSKNQKAAADYMASTLPALLNEIVTSGLSSSSQADVWKKTAGQLQVTAPTTINLVIDGQGYIRRQTGLLHFSAGAAADNTIEWTQGLDSINQPVTWSKETPKQVRPLNEILRLLPKPAQGK